jgi:hypothetical protein
MNEILAIVERLATHGHLSGDQIGSTLRDQGWTARPVARSVPSQPFTRHWQKANLLAGIQGADPAVVVEFTLWLREVDEDRGDWGHDALYQEAVTELRRLVREVESSRLADRLTEAEGDPTNGLDYLEHRAWRLSGRTLLLGATQDDTDLPVCVVSVIS